MRIEYKGKKGILDRCAIITYADNEHEKVMHVVTSIELHSYYKCDTGVFNMVIICVDDKADYDNLKELYKEFKSEQTTAETNGKETDNKETDNKETNSKETNSKETDNKETNSKETDNKETDNKETDSKETDNKETDSKGYMRCEYFFSLNPKSPPKCKHCIYSDRDFCPADGEKYWGICEE